MSGPLTGFKIVELAGIGPGPFCGMLFADMGTEVIRVDKVGAPHDTWNVATRGRRSIAVDLKSAQGREIVLRLLRDADGLIEGYRPGVTERLGLGPDDCLAVNPRLVYGRMTGWGQSGPLAHTAGHDIDYIAIAGALHGMGDPTQPPRPPQNFVGDYGGGAMFLAFGMLAAMMHARETGRGQVVDAAMTDGTALLTAVCHGRMTSGAWFDRRGGNILDGSRRTTVPTNAPTGIFRVRGHRAAVHRCDARRPRARGRAGNSRSLVRPFAVAATARTGRGDRADQDPRGVEATFDGTDACAAPVLSLLEAITHPHNMARARRFSTWTASCSPRRLRGCPRPRVWCAVACAAQEPTVPKRCAIGYSAAEIDGLGGKGSDRAMTVRSFWTVAAAEPDRVAVIMDGGDRPAMASWPTWRTGFPTGCACRASARVTPSPRCCRIAWSSWPCNWLRTRSALSSRR